MRYWWVNQNQTYRTEVRGSFIWSLKQNANGARNKVYDNRESRTNGDHLEGRFRLLRDGRPGNETGQRS
jgi:hypothetical protein